ncbi:amidohydrolase family protein [Chloroflexota bacterium]
MRIDIHSHFTPRDCLDAIDKSGKRFGASVTKDKTGKEIMTVGNMSLGPTARQRWDPEARIKDMDSQGIDMQVLSPSPLTLYYDLDMETALWYSRLQNEGTARAIKDYPTRFLGLAMIPLQEPGKALVELDRAINKLGLRGVEILSNVNGNYLDSRDLYPFYEAMEDLDLPIFIHPALNIAAADRLEEYELFNLIGIPLDSTIAVAHLIFSGILDKFPRLKFCISHAGGQAPYLRGRWEHGYEVRPKCRAIINHPPSYYLPLLYFDTVTHFLPALEYLVSSVGADKVIMGTDYPADMADSSPVRTVQSLVNVSEADKQKIMGDNAARLFKL